MVAAALSLALFAWWPALGFALAWSAGARRGVLQTSLLAPSLGLAATVLPLFWLSRWGWPIAEVAAPLGAGLAVLALVLWLWTRPMVPLRQAAPFALAVATAFLLTGRPLLRFGFDWLSYANDDMANYCLGAQRFLHHGYTEVPDLDQLLGGRDYSLFFWFLHVPGCSRSGAELVLAWVAALTGLAPDQIFMPVILALHLALVAAAGGLALACGSRRSALLATALVALSAETSLGAVYQLIAQVGGLGLLATCMALLTRRDVTLRTRPGSILVASLACAALLIFYPEVAPFLVLALPLHQAALALRGRGDVRRAFASWILILLCTALFLGPYVVSSTAYLAHQVASARSSARGDYVFSFFLLPSGFATLWGLLPFGSSTREPWTSVSIALGAAMLGWATLASARRWWNGAPAAALALPMLGLAFASFFNRSDFGLFKLAMFAQPALLAVLAQDAWGRRRRPSRAVLALGAVAALGAALAQRFYVDGSGGDRLGSLVEIPHASSGRLGPQMRALLDHLPAGAVLASDTYNIVLSKLEAHAARGRETKFLGSSFQFTNAFSYAQRLPAVLRLPILNRELEQIAFTAQTGKLLERVGDFVREVDTTCPVCGAPDAFVVSPLSRGRFDHVLASGADQTILNRRHLHEATGVVVVEAAALHDHLVFTASSLSRPYHATTHVNASMFQIEGDPLVSGATMAALGRHLRLRVLNPTSPLRVVLEITATFKGDGANRLPLDARVGGTGAASFPLLGRGSARVFSAPVAPLDVAGAEYLVVDLGEEGTTFPDRRTGLMSFFGNDIHLDARAVVVFGREISAVTEEEYERLQPPARLTRFPADLQNHDLEYSGLYEDGWASEASFVALAQPGDAAQLRVAGSVPLIDDADFASELRVVVDGVDVARQTLRPGRFEVRTGVPPRPGRRRVELAFSRTQTLPHEDGRPVGAQIEEIGFPADGAAEPG